MPESTKTRRTTPLEVEAPEPAHCSLDLRLRLLAQVPFFARLSPAEVREVDRSFVDRGFQAGDLIYAAGDPAGRLYVILAGTVKLVRHTLSGQDVVLDLLSPGEFFGALSVLGDEEYPDTAHAQTGCCLISIEAADFQAIMQRYSPVALAVVDVIQARLHAAHDMIRQLSAQPVDSRIAAALLKLADRMGRPEGDRILIRAPLSRQDLADMVGTTLETASRVISQFRKAGLIESGRQWIAVVDRAELEAIAQGESAPLRR